MNTLRLLRNIAALFILVMGLLALRPGVGVSHAAVVGYICQYKPGYNGCTFDANGHCSDTKCTGPYCGDYGCVQLKCQVKGCFP
jgi:hypothetical protein